MTLYPDGTGNVTGSGTASPIEFWKGGRGTADFAWVQVGDGRIASRFLVRVRDAWSGTPDVAGFEMIFERRGEELIPVDGWVYHVGTSTTLDPARPGVGQHVEVLAPCTRTWQGRTTSVYRRKGAGRLSTTVFTFADGTEPAPKARWSLTAEGATGIHAYFGDPARFCEGDPGVWW